MYEKNAHPPRPDQAAELLTDSQLKARQYLNREKLGADKACEQAEHAWRAQQQDCGETVASYTQNCAAMAPAGYDVQRKALLSDLATRQKMVAREFEQYETAARSARDHYDRLQKAISIITCYPDFELLSELLKLKVL